MNTVTFRNDLPSDIVLYDSFSSETNDNYFGDLTPLGTAGAHGSIALAPKHAFASVFIAADKKTDAPIARFSWLEAKPTSAYAITQADVDAMTQTNAFIQFVGAHADDPLTKSFHDLIADPSSDSVVEDVDAFFAKQPSYGLVTFATYMMAAAAAARIPPSKGDSPDPGTEPKGDTKPTKPRYSLRTLVALMGGGWPEALPDIAIASYRVEDKDGTLRFWAEVDLNDVPSQGPGAVAYLGRCLGSHTVLLNIAFHHKLGLALFGTRLSVRLEDLSIPLDGKVTLAVKEPTISLDISPLFKFVVFSIQGTIPFAIDGRTFDAVANMTIDNMEAAVGLVVQGDHSSLPAPPILRGIHFDEFGLGMGVFFEPPGYAVGVQGKFHIGSDKHLVELDDDTFAIVLRVEGGVPNPIYGSFYVPKMDFQTLLAIFTDTKTGLDLPVHFRDLSFVWSENPLEPVILPDGTLTDVALGCSAAVDVLSFGFYGKVQGDLEDGLTAHLEASPIAIGELFKLAGRGKGFSIKVDAQGNPIKNNALYDSQKLQAVLKDANDKTLVKPGGPVLSIKTLPTPSLRLSGNVSALGLVDHEIEAEIDRGGITFELDFGHVLSTKMKCTLSDWHNFAGHFTFGMDRTISLPHVGPVSLGKIHLQALIAVDLSIVATSRSVSLTLGAKFHFAGLNLSIPTFSVDVHVGSITDLLAAIGTEIENEAKEVFGAVLGQAEKWAGWVASQIITGVSDIAPVLKSAFNQSIQQAVVVMKAVGVPAQAVASSVRDAYNATGQAVAAAMKAAGFIASDVGGALKSAFNFTADQTAQVLRGAGYGAEAVGGALKTAFDATAAQTAQAMKFAGYGAQEVGRALKGTFTDSAEQVGRALNSAGYAAADIAGVAKDVFSVSAKGAADILHSIGIDGDTANKVLNGVGYAASEVAGALSSAFGWVPYVDLPHIKLPHINWF